MAFDRITDGDLLGKGNLGRPDTPGVDTAEMQRILDELPREVIVPAFNRLADQLETSDAAASLGAVPPESLPEDTPATVQGVLEAALNKNDEHIGRTDNPHAVTAAQTGAYTKEETDAAISQRVTEIGAGDMARAVYDPTGQKRDVFAAIGEAVAGAGHMEKSVYAASGEPGAVDRALRADSALAADDGVKVYTHTKSGTVHNFAGSGANGRAKLTADVQAGDTFTVNGVPVAAYVGADSAADAMAGGAWNGRWVSFTVEGGTLNFKGGGGKVTVTGLAAGAVKKGTTVTVNQGAKVVSSVEGTLTWQDLLPERNVGQSGATINAEFLGGLSNTSQGSINGNGITPGSSGNVAFCFTKAIDTNIYQAVEFKIGTVRYAVESSTIKVGLSGSVNIDYNSFTAVKQFSGVFRTGNVYRCDFNPGTSGYVKFANWNADLFVVETTLIKRQ
ncbi:hypothetical protein [Candidatus Allofournierella merdipullorum]|uniref:hypothetical protein n=1 Tax=Candidatus Allofournierella merdipullorum TaxID=2838595 RepID=UPI00374FBD23